MNRISFNATLILLAAGVGVVGGYFIGKRKATRKVENHQSLSATLLGELKESKGRLLELQRARNEMADELTDARFVAEECRQQFDRWIDLQESLIFVGPVLPSIPTSPETEILTQQRIAELECEVASLKELAGRNRENVADASTKGPTPSSTSQVRASDLPPIKEQCTALTKKGIRCTRSARANGKCWQHGG